MIEVVDGPRREQLAQRDLAQRRMGAASIEIRVRDEPIEALEIGRAQLREPVEQLVERRAAIAIEHLEPVKGVERPLRAVLEDALRALDPVRLLTGDEMADDVAWAPAARGVGGIGPGVWQVAKEDVEQPRRPPQQVRRVGDERRHRSILRRTTDGTLCAQCGRASASVRNR